MNTTPSAPTPVALAQTLSITSGVERAPTGSILASKKRKSFPDPLIFQNFRPCGMLMPGYSCPKSDNRRSIHGIMKASVMTPLLILLTPWVRSEKTIGISLALNPFLNAR
jgi:hypothetical protein